MGAVAIVLTVTPSVPSWRPQPFARTRMPSATDASIVYSAAPDMPTVGIRNVSEPPAERSSGIAWRASHQAPDSAASHPSAQSCSDNDMNDADVMTDSGTQACTT